MSAPARTDESTMLGALPGARAARAPVRRGSLARLLAGAAGSAALVVASLPPHGQAWAAWVALVPLCVGLRGERGWIRPALAGLAFGALVGAGVAGWVVPTLLLMGVGRLLHAAAVLAVLLLHQSLFYALFALLCVRLQQRIGFVLSVSLAWLAAEGLRLAAAPELAFLQLGHSQYQALWIAQGAELLGVSGLSALLAATNAALAEAWLSHRAGDASAAARRALSVACLLAALCAWGAFRVHGVESGSKAAPATRVAIVQVATPQHERWGGDALRQHNLSRHAAVTRRAVLDGAELIVWPETAIEQRLDTTPELREAIGQALSPTTRERGRPASSRPRVGIEQAAFAHSSGAPHLVAGAVRRDDAQHFYNSVAVFDASGAMTGVYDKQRLFPVSEYVPAWIERVPGARRAFAPLLRWEPFTPGRNEKPLVAGPLDLGVLVCFEGIDARIARERVAAGASVLLSAANDAILVGPGIAEQHFALTVFRAIELRRPLLRASNRGIGALTQPSGRTPLRLEPDEPGYLLVDVVPRYGTTLYEAGGWALPGIAIAASLLCCGLPRRRDA